MDSQIIFYLDLTTIMAQFREMALCHLDIGIKLLGQLGFILNMEKSDFTPTYWFTFLGFVWDPSISSVSLTKEKVAHLQLDACSRFVEKLGDLS